jgi:excisionase family DNA binding protein
MSYQIPVWEKGGLSVEEAAAYSGIGLTKLYEMTLEEDCPFVLWVGKKRLVKREAFDRYIDSVSEI